MGFAADAGATGEALDAGFDLQSAQTRATNSAQTRATSSTQTQPANSAQTQVTGSTQTQTPTSSQTQPAPGTAATAAGTPQASPGSGTLVVGGYADIPYAAPADGGDPSNGLNVTAGPRSAPVPRWARAPESEPGPR